MVTFFIETKFKGVKFRVSDITIVFNFNDELYENYMSKQEEPHSDIQPMLGCINDINNPGFRPGLLIFKPCRHLKSTERNYLIK